MDVLIISSLSALFSVIGSYVAIKIHVDYLRRDVDLAHRRIDGMMGDLSHRRSGDAKLD